MNDHAKAVIVIVLGFVIAAGITWWGESQSSPSPKPAPVEVLRVVGELPVVEAWVDALNLPCSDSSCYGYSCWTVEDVFWECTLRLGERLHELRCHQKTGRCQLVTP